MYRQSKDRKSFKSISWIPTRGIPIFNVAISYFHASYSISRSEKVSIVVDFLVKNTSLWSKTREFQDLFIRFEGVSLVKVVVDSGDYYRSNEKNVQIWLLGCSAIRIRMDFHRFRRIVEGTYGMTRLFWRQRDRRFEKIDPHPTKKEKPKGSSS